MMIRYKECLKNHAAAIGGNATDGCGEFMPSGEEGTLEALQCLACNCHRNFHRKLEKECECPSAECYHSPVPHLLVNNAATRQVIFGHTKGCPTGTLIRAAPPNKSGFIFTDYDDQDGSGGGFNGVIRPADQILTKKRFRTKFTQEQKEKMLRFAEKAEWRIQKLEESVVQQFCQEIGIKRRVLKVWMHNNKHSLAKIKNPCTTSTC